MANPPDNFDTGPQFGADIIAPGESDAMNKLAVYAVWWLGALERDFEDGAQQIEAVSGAAL